jgi:hypothetical protein
MMKPALRWATWRGASHFADAAGVPRADMHRRSPLAQSVRSLIPNIPE